MVSVRRLVTCIDLVPVWIVKIGGTVKFKIYEKLFLTSIMVTFIVDILTYPLLVKSIKEFVTTIDSLAAIPAALSTLWYIWFKSKEYESPILDFEILERLRIRRNCLVSDLLVFIFVLAHFAVLFAYTLKYTMLLYGLSFLSLNGAYAWIIIFHFQSQVIVAKHFNIQSLNVIIERIRSGESDVLEMLSTIRQLLKKSNQVNKFYSQIATASYGYCFTSTVTTVAYVWTQFGAKQGIVFQENAYDLCVTFSLSHVLVVAVNLVCSAECNKVEEIRWIIHHATSDVQMKRSFRTRLVVILQELLHYPLEFTAMDFFTVGCSSYTVVCGLVVNFMLIFVQFME